MKKNKIDNTKKIVIIVSSMFIIIVLLLMFLAIRSTNKKKAEEEKTSSTALQSIEDIIRFYESDYYKQEKSKEDGYDLDIYLSFKYDLFEGDESKESFFKMLIESLVKFDGFENIRLIDEEKDITIEVKCDKKTESITAIYYNGDSDYFRKQISNKSIKNSLKIKPISPTVNSEILNKCISENWTSKNIDFGTQESTLNKYNIYFDEGYKTRTIQGKLFNIVFTKKYNGEIINGLKAGDDFLKIERAIGDGFSFSEEGSGILSYKTKDFYIFFSSDEISIYPNIDYSTDEFEKIVNDYKGQDDIIDFMDKLTDLWPDYDYYKYDTSYLKIKYTLKGIEISYNIDDLDGIKIYENNKGKYTDNENIVYQLDKNLVLETETNRLTERNISNSPNQDNISNSFIIQITEIANNGDFKGIKIRSIDKQYPDSELDETVEVQAYYWISDYQFIYSYPYKRNIFI